MQTWAQCVLGYIGLKTAPECLWRGPGDSQTGPGYMANQEWSWFYYQPEPLKKSTKIALWATKTALQTPEIGSRMFLNHQDRSWVTKATQSTTNTNLWDTRIAEKATRNNLY